MLPNTVIGRGAIYSGYPPSEDEYTIPDPGLTLAIVFFCIVGPFWLIYRFIKYLSVISGLVPDQAIKVIK